MLNTVVSGCQEWNHVIWNLPNIVINLPDIVMGTAGKCLIRSLVGAMNGKIYIRCPRKSRHDEGQIELRDRLNFSVPYGHGV